ncbi:MAG TPA: isoprenyl transferase [Candidatus Angelobacter sp.]|nr:isoprenyl transferase [Candidatus Angelobacter sp.]
MRTIVPSGLGRREAEIFSQLDPDQLPRHIAIIMDGNGRWAKRRHLPRIAGHKRGVEAVRNVVETAALIKLPALTLYAFSAENFLRRPPGEINFLMKLLDSYLRNELPLMQRNNIRLSFIGRCSLLPQSVQERMAWALEETSRNTGMVLTLALNYSSRSEIVDAFRSMIHAARNNGGLDHLLIDEETVNRHLYTHNLPELDLVIRTSGELRLSNFLLWQAAYAELYVTKTFWPDFRGAHLLEAIAEYQQRERRYGGLSADRASGVVQESSNS